MVREDCTQRLDELSRIVPSIIFAAKDGSGRDLSAVAVTVDGNALVDHLDGSALEIDPGEHTFGFTAGALPSVTLKLVIREGERARHEEVLIGAPAAQPAAVERKHEDTATTNPLTDETDSGSRQSSDVSTQRVLAWTALGVGAAGLVVGSVFGLESKSKHDKANACTDTCPDAASHDANQSALKFGNISTVAFIVGAVGVAGGLTLWFTAKPAVATATASASSSAGTSFGLGFGSVHARVTF